MPGGSRNFFAYTSLGRESSWAFIGNEALVNYAGLFECKDAISYKSIVYALTSGGKFVCIDVHHAVVNILVQEDFVVITHRGVVDSWFRLVQSSKGDLLLVQRSQDDFKVYMLLIDEETSIIGKVEMNNLGGDTLFVGRHGHSLCAASSMGFASDSIYHVNGDDYYSRCEFNVYSMEDCTVTSFNPHNSWLYYPSPVVWFVPPFEFHSHK